MTDRAAAVVVLDGSTFAVSDGAGNMDPATDPVAGLYFQDMRHLSEWELTVEGATLSPLTRHTIGYDEVVLVLTVDGSGPGPDPAVRVRRHRHVSHGMRERLIVESSLNQPTRLVLHLRFDADFADLFEVKDHLAKKGRRHRELQGSAVVLSYRRGGFSRQTRIRSAGAELSPGELRFRIELPAHGRWEAEVDLQMVTGDHRHATKRQPGQPNMELSLEEWLDRAPALTSDWDTLVHTYHRSLVDLAALRFYPASVPQPASLPAAGLPWFMALFGRDSILTSYLSLPFVPELAGTTLRALAALQATGFDDFRDAEPGKILHELRHGELVWFRERPQSPYYGASDTTPLFLVLLDEYERWTADAALARDLEAPARAALNWVERYGDLDGDGYLEYQTRNPTSGIANQSWKDSGDAIVHPDGSLVALPRATCELQGYAYAARRAGARLAREVWGDDALAARLEAGAAALQARFDRDFWLDDLGCYALALDGHKVPVRTIASNMGHLLWSGIVPPARQAAVVARLLAPDLFSGWGVRTLAEGQGAYNPLGYHVGAVWPHDNALIALGFARSGARAEAARLTQALLEAAAVFDHRLPEAFAGISRAELGFPVAYPTACSPQAWASAAPLGLLRAVLGMEAADHAVTTDPVVPEVMRPLRLTNVPGPHPPSGGVSA